MPESFMSAFVEFITRRAAALLLLVACWAAIAGCGTDSIAEESDPRDDARRAAVRLLLRNANATALPRAYQRGVLGARMRRYMARKALPQRVGVVAQSIAELGGKSYKQSWTDSITVGEWGHSEVDGRNGVVAFVGYKSLSGIGGKRSIPLARYTVSMHRERGRWKLVSYHEKWLTSAGPMGDPGKLTIEPYPERIVFRNPRPGTRPSG